MTTHARRSLPLLALAVALAAAFTLACSRERAADEPAAGASPDGATTVVVGTTMRRPLRDADAPPEIDPQAGLVPRESAPAGPAAAGSGVVLEAGSLAELQERLGSLRGPGTIRLAAGEYVLARTEEEDTSCASCPGGDAGRAIPMTRAIRVSGRGIRIVGAGPDATRLRANAGVGVLFDGCDECALEGVRITDVIRDRDVLATSAGVVVRGGRVRVADVVVTDADLDEGLIRSLVSGVHGIVGRRGAVLDVERCRILASSWDGIALYEDAQASVRDTVVDGVEEAAGRRIGGGRGTGMSAQGASHLSVERCLVTRHWRGIGAHERASVHVTGSVIEDLGAWGIGTTDSATGSFERCAIHETGACGAMLRAATAAEPTRIASCAFTLTAREQVEPGTKPFCEPVAIEAGVGGVIQDNVFYANRGGLGAVDGADLDRAEFARRIAPLAAQLSQQPATAGSQFVQVFGRMGAGP